MWAYLRAGSLGGRRARETRDNRPMDWRQDPRRSGVVNEGRMRKMEDKNDIFDQITELTTEQRNPRTRQIDLAPTLEIVRLINQEDRLVAEAVGKALEDIARVVELVVASFERRGRLLYFGAGTSGRLGVIDAAECPPTFGVDPGMVVGVIAGGRETVFLSREGIEDDGEGGARDVADHNVSDRDTVLGQPADAVCAGRTRGRARPRGRHGAAALQRRARARRGRRRDRRPRPGGRRGIDAHEGGQRAEDGTQHDHDRQYDQAGQSV
jgi:hypothetical protein